MKQHSYRTKIFSAILSVLMATQVFPFAVLADSAVIDSGGVTDPFPDYVPDAVYDDGETLSTVIPPDFC